MAPMRAVVDKETCIGCGRCVDECPTVFEIQDGVAVVKADSIPEKDEVLCRAAVDICPVEAISIVCQPAIPG